MTDESAFLRAVCDSPEDDLPRLVYADWLEDNAVTTICPECDGDGYRMLEVQVHIERETCPTCRGAGRVTDGRRERAEFIRVQCELAAVPAREMCSHELRLGRGKVCRLRRRGQDLEGRWGHRWAAAAFAPLGTTAFQPYRFRRGFVESITCPARTFLEHCHAIRNACPLRESTLTGDVDPDWFRGRAMREGGRREAIRLCKGGSKLGIVAAVYDAYRGRRSEWGRKLFLDLLHAEFRGASFRLADPVTVQNGQVRGGSVFPAGREESEDVFQFVRDNPGDFGVEPDGRDWMCHDDHSGSRPWMVVMCGCSFAPITLNPGEVNSLWQVELRDHQVQVREFVYRFLIGQCVNCRTVHHTTPTRQYAPTSPAYR